MARYRTTPRRFAEQAVRWASNRSRAAYGRMAYNRRRRRYRKPPTKGSVGLSFAPLALLVVLCGWAKCNPLPEETPAPSTRSGLIEVDETVAGYDALAAPAEDSPILRDSDDASYYKYDSYEDAEEYETPDEEYYGATTIVNAPFGSLEGQRVIVERVVDGDTMIVQYYDENAKPVRERVRFIGVNTPETVKKDWPIEPFGPEASEYTKRRVEEAGYVAVLVGDGDATDRYGRRLAFVYLGGDSISLNEDLARVGLGRVETKYNFSKEMKARLEAAGERAKAQGLGIYSEVAQVAAAQ